MNQGYARVSTDEQDTAPQVAALREAGCERIYEEKASGGRWDRPELLRMLEQLRAGDVVHVWKLDRLGRSLKDLLRILERIEAAGAGFRSITEGVDTTTAAGRMLMQMLGAIAEFEREMIRERTREGLKAAAARGVRPGRPRALSAEQRAAAVDLVQGGHKTPAEVARLFGVHPSTIARAVEAAEAAAL